MGNAVKKLNAEKNPKTSTDEAEIVFFDCQLCLQPISPSKKFDNNRDCPHLFCKHCIAKYIAGKIDMNVAEITCPGPNCEARLNPESCQGIIKKKAFQRWLDLLSYSAIAGLPKCYCPKQNCRALIVNECGGSVKHAMCPQCKQWYCFNCQIPWHNGRLCHRTSREMISFSDMMFMELTMGEKKLARCPNCYMYIELIPQRGYCIARCRCRTMFCFHCGKKCSKLRCDCLKYSKEIKKYQERFTCYVFLLGFGIIVAFLACIWLKLLLEKDDGNDMDGLF